MHLKFMDPEVTLKLLEEYKDTLTPLAEAREKFYQDQVCPRCSSTALQKQGDANTIFRANDPIARYCLLCQDCQCVFDPHSGLLIKMGNLGDAYEPAVPILKGPED